MAVIFALGALLRIRYVLTTPYWLREHDVWFHVEYLQLVSETLSVPAFDQCWLCYHPPLYYYLLAPWLRTAQAIWPIPYQALLGAQLFSLLFSLGALAAALWTAAAIFPQPDSWKRAGLMGLLMPAVVAARPRSDEAGFL